MSGATDHTSLWGQNARVAGDCRPGASPGCALQAAPQFMLDCFLV